MYYSSSNVFMTNNVPRHSKKHPESGKPETHQTDKISFFLSSFSSSQLVQNCMTLFVFRLNSSILYPRPFCNYQVISQSALRMFWIMGSLGTPFWTWHVTTMLFRLSKQWRPEVNKRNASSLLNSKSLYHSMKIMYETVSTDERATL